MNTPIRLDLEVEIGADKLAAIVAMGGVIRKSRVPDLCAVMDRAAAELLRDRDASLCSSSPDSGVRRG